MSRVKRIAAGLSLVLMMGVGAPCVFADDMPTPPSPTGAIETPGLKGAIETPGLKGAIETPDIISLIIYVGTTFTK
jgi:hypothetical protein